MEEYILFTVSFIHRLYIRKPADYYAEYKKANSREKNWRTKAEGKKPKITGWN